MVRKTKLKYSLSFPYIFHRAVGLLAFYQMYTVRNFTVETLVDLPFTLVYSERFDFSDIRTGRTILATFFSFPSASSLDAVLDLLVLLLLLGGP